MFQSIQNGFSAIYQTIAGTGRTISNAFSGFANALGFRDGNLTVTVALPNRTNLAAWAVLAVGAYAASQDCDTVFTREELIGKCIVAPGLIVYGVPKVCNALYHGGDRLLKGTSAALNKVYATAPAAPASTGPNPG